MVYSHSQKIHFRKSRLENGKVFGSKIKPSCGLRIIDDHIGHRNIKDFGYYLSECPKHVCKNCERNYKQFLKEIEKVRAVARG